MIRSLIISKARKDANDTDPVNPFHTDNECHGIIDDWAIKAAGKTNLPRPSQDVAFAQGAGGVPSSGENLNTDILAILSVIMFPTPDTLLQHFDLTPRSEEEMDAKDPTWKSRTDQARPSHYIVVGAMTAAAAEFSLRTITVDRRCDKAYTMRLIYIQLPAASTTGTKSPEFSPVLHKSAQYFLTWHMLEPRNQARANHFKGLYEKEMREAITLSPFVQDDLSANIWGPVPDHDHR